ncbi:hypothetical protein [Entomohabitans teleogrylli]|uniref:hypothetical protein n=1 Tax=Entomohabitans teleogrylli TaxID=1384589 RepID=UPI00073D344B|nr:hypothetical protein [Entomohabitans teleogrylli]
MAGIHLHPHDILDEGMDNILARIAAMHDVDHLFVEINTIFERNPYPTGILPHNPRHESVMGTGTLHIHTQPGDTRLAQRPDPGIEQGADPLMRVKEATHSSRFRVVPWANILNGDFTGEVENNQVIDFKGRPVEHWLCPNGPDVADFWQHTFAALKQRYGYDTFLIDRIRFPDWAGKTVNPAGLFSCFCPHCSAAMRQQGLAPEAVKQRLHALADALNGGDFDTPVDALLNEPLLQQWQVFRQRSVSRLVAKIRASAGQVGGITLWLDLWPPAYSWLLGQDYHELTRHAATLKHFPYHKLGGGADVQGLINHFAHDAAQQERAFAAFKRLFRLPYELSYQDFKARGFPIDFVAWQNNQVRQQSQPGTFIYSGIQMWNLPADQLIEAVDAARQSACDDLLYYCYGWADQALFDAISAHNAKGN